MSTDVCDINTNIRYTFIWCSLFLNQHKEDTVLKKYNERHGVYTSCKRLYMTNTSVGVFCHAGSCTSIHWLLHLGRGSNATVERSLRGHKKKILQQKHRLQYIATGIWKRKSFRASLFPEHLTSQPMSVRTTLALNASSLTKIFCYVNRQITLLSDQMVFTRRIKFSKCCDFILLRCKTIAICWVSKWWLTDLTLKHCDTAISKERW